MTLYWKTKTLLAKIETTYATDSVPTGAANAILASDVTFMPMEGEDVSRNLELATMGASPQLPAGIHAKISFSVEMVGSSGLGVAPGYGPLLRMCGVAETITAATRVEYNPVSSGHESGTIYFAMNQAIGNTTRHVMTGCRGSFVVRLNAQGIPVMVFTITGLFNVPTQQPVVSPNFTAFQTPQIANRANTPTFTVGGTAFALRDFEFDAGCDVQPRLLIGQEQVLIVDRAESIAATVEAVPVATYDPYSSAMNQTERVIQLVHGPAGGRRVTLDFPRAVQSRLSALQQQQQIVEWPLRFVPQRNSATGNDQWKITIN